MKKMFALLLALLMVFALAACGKTETPPPADTDVSNVALGEKAVTLTFWHSMTDNNGAVLEGLVETFNETVGAEHGVSVLAVYQGKYSDATTKLKAVLTGQKPAELPDVMQMDATGKILYATCDYAYTLDRILADHPEYDVNQLAPGIVRNWTYQNVRLGVPFAASTTVTYYNKTLFDSINAAAPQSIADLTALGGGAFGEGIDVITCLPSSATMNNWIQQLGSKTFDMDNGTEGNAAAVPCYEDGALEKFLTAWKALYESGALRNADTTTTDAFVAGQTAVMLNSTSTLNSVLSKVDGRFEVGVAPYLQVDAESGMGATGSGSALMAFDRGDALQMEAAWLFMQYMSGAEAQLQWGMGTGYLPVNTAVADLAEYQAFIAEKPQYAVGVQQLAATPGSYTSVTVGPAADIYYAVQNNVSEMLEDDLTPAECADYMAEELEDILGAYNRANS